MTDPVNVRIARFLDWMHVQSIGIRGGVDKWVGIPPTTCACCLTHDAAWNGTSVPCFGCGHTGAIALYQPIPDFEHDWSATGPIIDRFGVRPMLLAGAQGWTATVSVREDGSVAPPGEFAYDVRMDFPSAPTARAAICACVLALAEREQEKRA